MADEMNKIFVLDIEAISKEEVFDSWYDKMPEYRKKKIDAIKHQDGRKLSLAAGILLHEALEELGVSDEEVVTGENGKPMLPGDRGIYFSISHSGTMAAVATSDDEIGIDIEREREFNQKLINYIFNEEEISFAQESVDPEKRNIYYTKLWTVKEAVMKYYGKGLSMDPRRIKVSSGEEFSVVYEGKDTDSLNFVNFSVLNHQLTICSKYNKFSKVIKIKNGVN